MLFKTIIILISAYIPLIQSNSCPYDSDCVPYANCTAVRYNIYKNHTINFIRKKKCKPFSHDICCSKAEINYLLPSNCGNRIMEINKIGGNASLADPFQFPWMSIIGTITDGDYLDEPLFNLICGGFLINNRYVLTSAHCMTDKLLEYKVRLAEHNLHAPSDCIENIGKYCSKEYDIGVENVIRHPLYNPKTTENDIALLRLNQEIIFNKFVSPICLPINFYVNDENLGIMQIAGWGLTEKGFTADVLRTTYVNYSNFSDCNYYYEILYPLNSRYKLCAHGENSKDACKGDSGGPLMATIGDKMVAVGIITGGNSHCGANNKQPGLYERVSSHMEWIFINLRP